jgi:hypothetical protein
MSPAVDVQTGVTGSASTVSVKRVRGYEALNRSADVRIYLALEQARPPAFGGS